MHRRFAIREVIASDADVPALGSGSVQATLVLDGRAFVRGNRSRVVLIGSLFSSRLDELSGRAWLSVLRDVVPPWETLALGWSAPRSGLLLHVEHFGGLVLEGVRRDKSAVELGAPSAIERGQQLEVALRNPYGAPLRAEVVLLQDVFEAA